MAKIHIIGASGSGKTTLGQELASQFQIPHYDLDKDISKIEDAVTIAKKPAWITEGIYLIWSEPMLYYADHIVVLEVSWVVAVWRMIRRHLLNSLRGTNPYPGFNGLKALVKLAKDTRRYLLNLNHVDPTAVEALSRYLETHQEELSPPTGDFLQEYLGRYQELTAPPSEAFVRLYLERYKQKVLFVKDATDRERLFEILPQHLSID